MKTYKAIYFIAVLIAVTFSNTIFQSVVFAFTIFNLVDVSMKLNDEWRFRRRIHGKIKEDQLKQKQNG